MTEKIRCTVGPWTLDSDEHGSTLQYDSGYKPSDLPQMPFVVQMPHLDELNDLLYLLLRCSQHGERSFFLKTDTR